ncbi:hypothetical protein [Planctomycetes bacterium K23_9]|uniref:Uncharacterized protein n=1 Tax=Stieleria marina TaxID=1930275 RepID=A0A517NTS3_9BACT|nr:hypothetical protein K239x_24800 [Planctomycetes bacterium K23_9]QDT10971.1 hypothetical protein K239x_29640 [Planctomycetes bacterium K23_9]
MTDGTGVFHGPKSIGYARVHVRCTESPRDFAVTLALDDDEWNNQLRDGGFSDWTDAALAGLEHALRLSGNAHGQWAVIRVVGLVSDTIPRYIAHASALAAWDSVGYHAETEELESLLNWTVESFPGLDD